MRAVPHNCWWKREYVPGFGAMLGCVDAPNPGTHSRSGQPLVVTFNNGSLIFRTSAKKIRSLFGPLSYIVNGTLIEMESYAA